MIYDSMPILSNIGLREYYLYKVIFTFLKQTIYESLGFCNLSKPHKPHNIKSFYYAHLHIH